MNNIVEKEKQILEFWEKENIFQKSIRNQDCPNFVFYEGPPTANAKPGIHHIEARAFKDIICRYKTMKGFRVLRKAGWDTHGLPVEIEVEKKLGLKNKKEIEDYGIAEFNKKCQDSVWSYKKSWEDLTKRIGYWIDTDNPYITYSKEYIESVWWILKQIWKKGLLFQDYKIAPFCPRCGTTLSSHELAQGYQKIKEPSIYLKFQLKNQKNTYLLVWTTTPWTLPGNVAIAVNPNFKYVKVKINQENYILAQSALTCLKGQDYKELELMKGEELVDLEYQGLYKAKVEPGKKIYQVLAGDFVTAEEGTGLVHIAPAFGEDDYNLIKAQSQDFAFIISVDKEGKMITPGYDWNGLFVKKADPLIIKDLDKRGILFKQELYEHDYPFCWRCGTPLIYYAQSSWFIKMTELKQELLDNNEKINWIPKHIKQGRFGEWLREVKDWNLSRERYWGTPLPIWQCQSGKSKKCNQTKVIGSIKELEELSGQKIDNLHRPFIDKVTFKCDQCDGEMKRVPEVIDCWFDSGSMPLAQQHYPFENKKLVDEGQVFPADFICESLDQTRGWFYTLLAISTALGKGPSYKNVIVTGMVLDEKGKKMSKSKGNVIVPEEVIQKFGADCLRFYFYTLNQVDQPKKFSLAGVKDLYAKFFLTLENCLSFLKLYSQDISFNQPDLKNLDNILDQWIISETHSLIKKVTEKIDHYDVVAGSRLFLDFLENLSNWYIRCSRPRFQRSQTEQEKQTAVNVLSYVLKQLAKLLAPFTPFIAESIYQDLKTNSEPESVHLTDYPEFDADLIQPKIKSQMQKTKEIVALALAQRAQQGIKLRQPLNQVEIPDYKLEENLLELIKQEVNVKKVIVNQNLREDIKLDTKITPELAQEGRVREIIRQIQQGKKELKVKPHDQVKVFYQGDEELNQFIKDHQSHIEKQTAVTIEQKLDSQEEKNKKTVKIQDKQLNLWLEKGDCPSNFGKRGLSPELDR